MSVKWTSRNARSFKSDNVSFDSEGLFGHPNSAQCRRIVQDFLVDLLTPQDSWALAHCTNVHGA